MKHTNPLQQRGARHRASRSPHPPAMSSNARPPRNARPSSPIRAQARSAEHGFGGGARRSRAGGGT